MQDSENQNSEFRIQDSGVRIRKNLSTTDLFILTPES
jgi:hypothetical protein